MTRAVVLLLLASPALAGTVSRALPAWELGTADPAKLIEDLEKARWYIDRRIAQARRA